MTQVVNPLAGRHDWMSPLPGYTPDPTTAGNVLELLAARARSGLLYTSNTANQVPSFSGVKEDGTHYVVYPGRDDSILDAPRHGGYAYYAAKPPHRATVIAVSPKEYQARMDILLREAEIEWPRDVHRALAILSGPFFTDLNRVHNADTLEAIRPCGMKACIIFALDPGVQPHPLLTEGPVIGTLNTFLASLR